MTEPGKTTSRRTRFRKALAGLLITLAGVILAVGLIAPFVDAERWSGPIHRALESSLDRRVEFGAVHFTLFSGPGFSLEDVVIGEDPRYGLEPFAYVPVLQARVRFDKLLFGQMRFASLRLVGPSLNLVKQNDGTWNVVPLVERLSAPRRAPLNLFPAFEVSSGRIDFKFGQRKTTLYLLDTDLSIYPERSGKLYIQFSGSPARTDRAGNGFGHVRGTANWYVNPASAAANQLEADVTLDPSNLSELTTLVEGHDVGVHGTVSSRAHIEGPSSALRISGELRLADVHRWDLLPANGGEGQVRYRGNVDWINHRLDIQTVPWREGEPTRMALELRAGDFLRSPNWSVLTHFNEAPVEGLLPLAKRLGLAVPANLSVTGALEGTLEYSNARGLSGEVAIRNAAATLPHIPALHTDQLSASITGERVHFRPAKLDAPSGTLQASGDLSLLTPPTVTASFAAEDFPTDTLKGIMEAWFGSPASFGLLANGNISGEFGYRREAVADAVWSGQFNFYDATVHAPGLAGPLENAQGQVAFDDTNFDLSRFTGTLGQQVITAAYHSSPSSKHPARLHIECEAADLSDLEAALAPALEDQSLLGRLHVSRRLVPAWLAARNVEGDLEIPAFSVNATPIGALSSHFLWQGTAVQLSSLRLKMPEGSMQGRGNIALNSYLPRYHFFAKATAFPWRGGFLSADGQFETSGIGRDTLQHLHAGGTFSGQDVSLSPDEAFGRVGGFFTFSFADGWPDLRLSKLQVDEGEDAWSGAAASQSDGKLVFDLERAGRQRRVVSTLDAETPGDVSRIDAH